MESKALIRCYASTSRVCSFKPLKHGLDSHSITLFHAASSAILPSSRFVNLVLRAQQQGEHFHNKAAVLITSPYVRTPWNTSEDDKEINILVDMPGIGAETIEVKVIDDILVIIGNADKSKCIGRWEIFEPYDCRVQLPASKCCMEDITAVFRNGTLYITVPKITQIEHEIIHIPVKSV